MASDDAARVDQRVEQFWEHVVQHDQTQVGMCRRRSHWVLSLNLCVRFFFINNKIQAQFKAQAFPLARLRRIAKLDENMRTMSTEVPLLLAKAAEAFVHELSLRSWDVTKYTRRCTIAVSCSVVFRLLLTRPPWCSARTSLTRLRARTSTISCWTSLQVQL